MGVPPRRGIFPLLAREFAPLADRLASVAGAARRAAGRDSTAPARRWSAPTTADRSAGSRPRPRSSSCPASRADRRRARRGRTSARPTTRPWPRSVRASTRPPRRPRRRRSAAFERTCRDEVLPRERGRGPPRRGAVRPEDAPHDALRRADAGTDPGGRRARVRRRPGRDGPARPRPVADLAAGDEPHPADDGALVRGVLDAIADRAPGAGRAARLLPRGERPDRGVLPRARPHRPGRRAARHPLDAGLPARLRRRDAHLAGPARQGPRRRSSRSRRCPTTGRPSSASRTCARTTTGCSGC